jgi:hypothetical protein
MVAFSAYGKHMSQSGPPTTFDLISIIQWAPKCSARFAKATHFLMTITTVTDKVGRSIFFLLQISWRPPCTKVEPPKAFNLAPKKLVFCSNKICPLQKKKKKNFSFKTNMIFIII